MIPKKVLRAFGFVQVVSTKLLTSGLIHQTYLVKNNRTQYIIQRLHPILATPEIAHDFQFVTGYLHDHGFLAPECILSKKGSVLVDDGKWKWRAQTYLNGRTHHILSGTKMAFEAGKMYADFHQIMNTCSYPFESKKVLHDTQAIFQTFQKTVKDYRDSELFEPVKDDVAFLLRHMPNFFLPANLPVRVIHGDPKVSNILFSPRGEARALVDLDTCNRRSVLVELGDAFRSWCGKREDDPKNRFSLSLFRSAWKGYVTHAPFLTKTEKKYVAKSIGTITLELSCRFLTDYFVDAYFGWDSQKYKTRRAHNLARVRGQLAEFRDYEKNRKKIEEIVKKVA